MSTKIFINLPVKDLKRSQDFYKALGFTFNPQFTDEKAACLVISEHNYAMLLTHAFFQGFINRPMVDARKQTGVLIAISRDSREDVDAMLKAALAAGGEEPRAPQDYGFMYGRAFEDPDGHIWEPMWMDPAYLQSA